MRIEDYPPQEPLSEVGQTFADEVMARGEGVSAVDVQYGDDPYRSIAIQTPVEPDGAVLAMMHGGGWTSGYKEHLNFAGPGATARGVVYASIGYRLAPQHLFPTGFEDSADAVAWLYRNVAEMGGDPARIFVGGHSAGGHYAALLAVRKDWQAKRGLPDDVVRGCLPISGVFRFGEGSGLSARPRFLGPESNDRPASPVLDIQATPPFLIAHGGEDFPHLMTQAEEMEGALRGAGGDVTRLSMPGRNHFSACYAAGEEDGPWVGPAFEWMAAH